MNRWLREERVIKLIGYDPWSELKHEKWNFIFPKQYNEN